MDTFIFYCVGYLLGKYEDKIINFLKRKFGKR